MSEINYEEIVSKALEAFDKRDAERKAVADEAEAEREKLRAEVREEVEAENQANTEAWRNRKGQLSVSKLSNPLEGDHTASKAFMYWMRTGEVVEEMKALESNESWGPSAKALQEGDAAEGGYLVPDDVRNQIVQKRDEQSWPREAGVQVLGTSRDVVKVPVEATAFAEFSVTAEEAAYTTNDPAFGQESITIYKFTKLTKLSDELLDDDACNLEGFISQRVGDAWGLTESHYCATGTGSSQPEGVFVGGDTDAVTFTCTGDMLAAEIPELMYSLKHGYRKNAIWLCDPQTEYKLRAMRDANAWTFDPGVRTITKDGSVAIATFYGRPMFNDDNIATMAAGTNSIAFGDPAYYLLVERQGLRMRRNPYLYMANGQVGFFWDVRFGGVVLMEEAWKLGQMAAS